MRVLIVLVHYFSAEPNPRHASVDAARRADRAQAIQRVIRGYRGMFGPTSTIRFGDKTYELNDGSGPAIDLRVLTVPDRTLVDPEFRRRWGVHQTSCTPDNPRMLGFYAYQIFQKTAGQYDWYVYSEDDLLVGDSQMFEKLAWFNRTFGDRRVLSPNRIEWNDKGKTQKTYIDGDLSAPTARRLIGAVDDEWALTGAPLAGEVTFRRALNPHSGFFAITASQLSYWMGRPHWRDLDVSFVSPLESAATLGLTKTFSVYKPHGRSANFLEVEHLDNRFSSLKWPLVKPKTLVKEAS